MLKCAYIMFANLVLYIEIFNYLLLKILVYVFSFSHVCVRFSINSVPVLISDHCLKKEKCVAFGYVNTKNVETLVSF